MPHQTALCRAFVAEAMRLFEEHPEIAHTWTIAPDSGSCTLMVPKLDEHGFDITIEVDFDDISWTCGSFQASDFLDEETAEEFAGHTVGFLYDLLTPLIRLREKVAGGRPHEWHLECRRGGRWEPRGCDSRRFFRYWGKRGKRIYQNHTLPLRDAPLKS